MASQLSTWRLRHGDSGGQANEVAKAVTAELLPKLEEAMQRRLDEFLAKLRDGGASQTAKAGGSGGSTAPARSSFRGSIDAAMSQNGAGSGTSEDKVAKASSSLDALVPQLDRLMRSADELDRSMGSRSVRSSTSLPKEQFFERRLEVLERRMARKVDESVDEAVLKIKEMEGGASAKAADTSGHATDEQWNARALALVNEEIGGGQESVKGIRSTGRTFVVNVRRLRRMLEFGQLYTHLVQTGALIGVIIIALNGQNGGNALSFRIVHGEGDVWDAARFLVADFVFLVCGSLLHVIHTMQHGHLRTSSIATLGLGDHVGSGGQTILDNALPGVNNPDACIQSLTWVTPFRYRLAWSLELWLRACCLVAWVVVVLAWDKAILSKYWNRDFLVHLTALTSVGTVYLFFHFLYGRLVERELHFVLPWKNNGEPWDVVKDGVPGALGWLLGPPCVWFGSPDAYDDLRIWVVLSSRRPKRWAVSMQAPMISPAEMGIFSLRGSASAARLAQSLRSSKLYDSHRQVFVKRRPQEEDEGKRPSVVVTSLSRHSGKGGHLHDVDLRRELPEALNLNLVLYDARTTLTWSMVQTAPDPSHWISVKRWQSRESLNPDEGYITQEEPVWDAGKISCSTSTTDVFCGTFGGYSAMVHIARGQASFVDASTGASDIRADAMALKKTGSHPNLLVLYTSGNTAEGRPYMAVESYESIGCLLSQLINQHSWEKVVLPVRLTVQLLQGLVDGLAHLHSQDIIHRCLRAEGVVVTMEHRAKLADLGMVTKSGARDELKASHFAPEVCQGGAPQGPPADCWGLGVILHEIYQGRSDLVDSHVYPPRPRPDSPSTQRGMDFFVQTAMTGLLDFDPKRRWNLDTLQSSALFTSWESGDGFIAPLLLEHDRRRYLRRYLGHAPPPGACVADVALGDKGVVGKTLEQLDFKMANVEVLLVARKGGRYCAPQPTTKVEVGDSICFGLMPEFPMADLVKRLGSRFAALAPAEPPVTGFERAPRPALAVKREEQEGEEEEIERIDSDRGGYAMGRLMTFNAEFDCFCLPDTLGHDIFVSTLRRLHIPIAGVLRAGHWWPQWFPDDSVQVRHGDLGLIFRAPKSDGSSVPILSDDDMEVLMNEKDLEARFAVHRGLGLEDAW